MRNTYKQKREQGFTIIEVMIVLAIAAVILLIVLLAVPALQRNSRNTQRNNDAASIAAAINTCMANHNSQVDSCGNKSATATAGSGNNVDVDFAKLGQITAAIGNGSSCTPSTTTACWYFANTCNPDATDKQGGTSREFAVLFNVETSNGGAGLQKCVSS